MLVIPEGNSRVLKLQAGEIDAALEIPLNQMQSLGRAGTIKTAVANVLRSDFVLMNTKKKPFDDVRVRQALNYAIDKEGLVKALLYGAGKVANSPMPLMAYADPDLKPYAHDIAKAKALLKEAGYADGFKTSLLVHSGRPLHRQLGQALQSALAQIGVPPRSGSSRAARIGPPQRPAITRWPSPMPRATRSIPTRWPAS